MVPLKIADCCDDAGRNAWPSIASLERYCRCSRSTVKRSITELEELGELEVETNGGGTEPGSRYAPNLYRVVIEGYQNEPPQARGGSPEAVRGFKSGRSGGPLVDHNSPIEPSRTAGEPNRTIAAAHLRLAREALGLIEQAEKESDGEEIAVEHS
jgi:hypothetical protein